MGHVKSILWATGRFYLTYTIVLVVTLYMTVGIVQGFGVRHMAAESLILWLSVALPPFIVAETLCRVIGALARPWTGRVGDGSRATAGERGCDGG